MKNLIKKSMLGLLLVTATLANANVNFENIRIFTENTKSLNLELKNNDGGLEIFIKDIYGVELYKTHHLETLDGTPVDDVDTFYYNQNKYALQYQPIVPVRYDTYERLENESRRTIRYIKNEYLQQIEEEIKNILTKQPDNLSKFL